MNISPLAELRSWLADTADRCRSQRWFGPLFRVNVATDILADAEKAQKQAAEDAYSAEQYDLEAVRVLNEAARDGFTNADIPEVARAVRLIRQSAQKDRRVTERLASA